MATKLYLRSTTNATGGLPSTEQSSIASDLNAPEEEKSKGYLVVFCNRSLPLLCELRIRKKWAQNFAKNWRESAVYTQVHEHPLPSQRTSFKEIFRRTAAIIANSIEGLTYYPSSRLSVHPLLTSAFFCVIPRRRPRDPGTIDMEKLFCVIFLQINVMEHCILA